MTNKEFKHLRRSELIDIIYELQKNERKLQAELEAVKKQLASKEMKIAEAGSIAEAVAGLSGIFEKAQETADEYLEQIYQARLQSEKLLEDAKQQAAEILQQAEQKAQE